MSSPYDGQDATGLPINAYIPGKGYWLVPNLADDSDDRDAASYGVGVEGFADRTVWIGWRMVNGLEGNTVGTPYPGNLWWSGAHTHSGAMVLGSTLAVTGTTALTGNVTVTNALTVGGNFTANGAGIFNDPVVHTDKTTYQGNDAYRIIRSGAGPDSGSAGSPTDVNPWEKDTWVATLASANRVWKLADPPGAIDVVILLNGTAYTLELRTSANSTILTLGADPLPRSVVLHYTGTIWLIRSRSVF